MNDNLAANIVFSLFRSNTAKFVCLCTFLTKKMTKNRGAKLAQKELKNLQEKLDWEKKQAEVAAFRVKYLESKIDFLTLKIAKKTKHPKEQTRNTQAVKKA